jgi:hypothetical protein
MYFDNSTLNSSELMSTSQNEHLFDIDRPKKNMETTYYNQESISELSKIVEEPISFIEEPVILLEEPVVLVKELVEEPIYVSDSELIESDDKNLIDELLVSNEEFEEYEKQIVKTVNGRRKIVTIIAKRKKI